MTRTAGFSARHTVAAVLSIVALAPLVVAVTVDSPVPESVRFMGALLWALCLAPSFGYVTQRARTRRPIPFVQIAGILYGIYFALPAAFGAYNQHWRIVLNPATDYDAPVTHALLGWVVLLIGYGVFGVILAPIERPAPPLGLSAKLLRGWGFALLASGLVFDLLRRTPGVSETVSGVLTFGSTLGWLGSGLIVLLFVRGQLPAQYRFAALVAFAGMLFLAIGTGSVANAAYLGLVLVLSAWIARGRLGASWIAGMVLGGALLVSMRGVSEQFRRRAWFGQAEISHVDRGALFFSLLSDRVESRGMVGALQGGAETTRGRSANLDLFADVVRRTPGEVPYWGGETYLSLVGAVIPRVIWPSKPTKRLGQTFGHRYGYVGGGDRGTAVNLPWLVEFFVNFGAWGVIFGTFLVGAIYRLLQYSVNVPGQDELLSLVGVVFIRPLLNIESDLSLTFGGLLLNGIALWFVLQALRRTAQRRARSSAPSEVNADAGLVLSGAAGY